MSKEQDSSSISYSIGEHRHRFASWAAARAAGRGQKDWKAGRVQAAIEGLPTLRAIADGVDNLPDSQSEFDLAHSDWCNALAAKLQVKFGRAAKIIAIYLKALTCGLSPVEETRIGFVYPPVDRILLTSLPPNFRSMLAPDLAWSRMTEAQHRAVIDVLRKVAGQQFWEVERYWKAP
jgi:hypothetical protein